jgi:hypothetical protein
MRAFALTAAGALLISAQLAATVARADDTTVIRHGDDHGSTTVIKKTPEVRVLPVPHPDNEKVIIHHND